MAETCLVQEIHQNALLSALMTKISKSVDCYRLYRKKESILKILKIFKVEKNSVEQSPGLPTCSGEVGQWHFSSRKSCRACLVRHMPFTTFCAFFIRHKLNLSPDEEKWIHSSQLAFPVNVYLILLFTVGLKVYFLQN